jgi:phosphatidate cytidylyltransferase
VFWLAASLAAAQSAREAIGLFAPAESELPSTAIVVSSIALVVAAAAGPTALVGALGLALVLLLAFTLLTTAPSPKRRSPSAGLAAIIYAGLPLALLVLLRNVSGPALSLELPSGSLVVSVGAAWVLAVFSVTWAVDTVAYLVGRAIGRHPFSPRLSPKKTWEGTVAGLAAGTLAFAAWAPPFGWSVIPALSGGFLLSIASVTGDLVESALKRSAGIKDAGSILPGHGGILDRIDSLAFSVVVVFLIQALDQSVHLLGR